MISVSNIVLPHPNPPLVRGGYWILLFFVCSPILPNPSQSFGVFPVPCSLFPNIKITCLILSKHPLSMKKTCSHVLSISCRISAAHEVRQMLGWRLIDQGIDK